MGAIFISYRREDAEGEAGRLFDDLSARFGADKVFMDVVGIEPGRDFRKVIDQNVSSCSVLLAIMGRDWLGAASAAGKRRLDDPSDFVRLETAAALKRDIPVIPVFVRGGSIPRADQLPDDLKDLAYRNGVELTHARWSSDVQLLIGALCRSVEQKGAESGEAKAGPVAARASVAERPASGGTVPLPPPATSTTRSRSIVALAGLAIAIAVGGFALYEYREAQVAEAELAVAAKEEAARELAARETRARNEAAKAGGKEAGPGEKATTKAGSGKEIAAAGTGTTSPLAPEQKTPEPTKAKAAAGTGVPCPLRYKGGAALQPGTRVIHVMSSDPASAGAEVWLDGICVATITKEAPDRDAYDAMLVNIPPGAHEVKVIKKGYAEFHKALKLASSDQFPEKAPKVVVRVSMQAQ